MTASNKINPAKITWQTDENGLNIPTSTDFGDVYFSTSDGLAESRYVFIEGNDLANRLENLSDFDTFVIGEIGFGTGLNVLAIWQLWHSICQKNPHSNALLHIITTEKFPLTKNDLAQALSFWQELQPFSQQLIDNYPPPLAGCHRLNFWSDRLTLDIWLGDATDSLAKITGNAKVNAWLLNDFTPACNGELWANELFSQIARLSNNDTTLATFSVASVVKKSLSENGFTLAKRKGFGKKLEMLTAKFNFPFVVSLSNHEGKSATPCGIYSSPSTSSGRTDFLTFQSKKFTQFKFKLPKPTKLPHYKKTGSHFAKPPFSLIFARKKVIFFANPRPSNKPPPYQFHLPTLSIPKQPLKIAIIGAGVAGLSTAWALAVRGHQVTLIDKDSPLSGASGNPRAVIAPKLTELERLPSNLHAIGYLASLRYYPALAKYYNTMKNTSRLAWNDSDTQQFLKCWVSQALPNLQNFRFISLSNKSIFETTGVLDLLAHNRVTAEQVSEFPPEFAVLLSEQESEKLAGVSVGEAIFYPQAGLVNTENFAKAVLSHPNIKFLSGALKIFEQIGEKVKIEISRLGRASDTHPLTNKEELYFDHVILCTAQATCNFLPDIKPFNFSRGQVSWVKIEENSPQFLPKLPLKYGGYCAKFSQNGNDYFMLGASFIRNTLDTTPTDSEHQSNLAEFETAIGKELETPNLANWQGRAGIRSQTVDYLPLVGQAGSSDSRIWTFSALGSKGYCYAPVSSELLAGLICGEILGLDKTMVEKLSPNRRVINF